MLLILSCVLVAWTLQHADAACPTIIEKPEWDAIKPKHVKYLTTPVDLVIIQHTVTQACSDDLSCVRVVRDLQKTHVEKSFLWDIGPSFLVGGNGQLYEGRGWNHVAVHTSGYNNQSIAIAFIGSFNNYDPSPKALNAVRALIQCGVEENVVSADHKVVVHSQLISTESPGKKLAVKVMTWPDWQKDVSEIKKKADKQELQQDSYTTKTGNDLILQTPKQIDSLSSLRDVIGELLDSMNKLAHHTLETATSFTTGMNKIVSVFNESLSSGIKKLKEQLAAAYNAIPAIPGVKKCAKSLKEEGDAIHESADAKAQECAQQRIKEVNDMVENLSKLTSNAIDYTNTAVQNTRNCTELNVGIESPTKSCLNSVTQQTQSASNTYSSQKTLAVDSIRTSMAALPAALELCSKKHLLEAGTKTTKVIASIASCPTKGITGFGF